MGKAYIGTSGYAYKEWRTTPRPSTDTGSVSPGDPGRDGASGPDAWRPLFYPEKMPEKGFLPYYASRLGGVEIDYTFYRMPNARTLDGWRQATPEGFKFALKASQKITHWERLKVPS